MPYAPVNGTEIYYQVQGDGPPILLLPGLGTDASYYQLGEPILRDSFTTILVDPRGIGRSKLGDGELRVETWADDFAALLDHLEMAPVHVLGSSHGGSMALALADQSPESVRSLILIGAFSELDLALEMNFRLRIKIVSQLGMGDVIADHAALWIMSRKFLESAKGQKASQGLLAAIQSNTPESYIALCESILHWGRKMPGQENEPLFTERLGTIRCPTLAITGDSDHMIPEMFSKQIAESIPGAEYVEIPDCGHIPVLERPEEACRIVGDYVTRLESGAAP